MNKQLHTARLKRAIYQKHQIYDLGIGYKKSIQKWTVKTKIDVSGEIFKKFNV